MHDSSKTTEPCDCGWIALAMENPASSGVHFSSDRNMIFLGCDDSRWPMHHCPFCGGAYPDSSRPIWVPVLSPDERSRLEELGSGHASVESIVERLGPPDYDALMHRHRTKGGDLVREDSIEPTRNIEYHSLSELANLEFYIAPDKTITSRITMKPLSPRHLDEKQAG